MKEDPGIAETPVVIISSSPDEDRARAVGARRVLLKPFSKGELIEAISGVVGGRIDPARFRVLVVDDNVKAVNLVTVPLEAEGFIVLKAYGGREAIQAAREALPDLVILDLMMPDVSGFEVARALRETESTARIPIVVLTAKDLSAEERARLNGDVAAILEKPAYTPTGLLAEVRRALPKRPKT